MAAFIKKLLHKHQWEDLPLWRQRCKECLRERSKPIRRIKHRSIWRELTYLFKDTENGS